MISLQPKDFLQYDEKTAKVISEELNTILFEASKMNGTDEHHLINMKNDMIESPILYLNEKTVSKFSL